MSLGRSRGVLDDGSNASLAFMFGRFDQWTLLWLVPMECVLIIISSSSLTGIENGENSICILRYHRRKSMSGIVYVASQRIVNHEVTARKTRHQVVL